MEIAEEKISRDTSRIIDMVKAQRVDEVIEVLCGHIKKTIQEGENTSVAKEADALAHLLEAHVQYVAFYNMTKDSEEESNRVPLKQAAKELGMSAQGVREHMKRKLFKTPIGEVVEIDGKYQYHIYRNMLDKHLGKTIES